MTEEEQLRELQKIERPDEETRIAMAKLANAISKKKYEESLKRYDDFLKSKNGGNKPRVWKKGIKE